MAENTERSDPPLDGISSLHFSPTDPSKLLVTSWDTLMYLYNVDEDKQLSKFDHRAAVLDCCWADGKHAYSGGLDLLVREWNVENESSRNLGQHDAPVSRLSYAKESSTVITGSWDRTLRTWDPRLSNAQTSSISLPERVYNMDITGNTLVVAMASRIFHIYDVRKLDRPLQERESSLKFLTRALGCMVTGEGYATGSVEGRIAVEYFDPSPKAQEEKYAFKCHRQTIDGVDNVFPVNAIVFHPIYNTFASGGSDGTVSIWDHKSKKRLRQYPRYPNAVPALAFNCDGSKLAIAVNYSWDEGPEPWKTSPRPALHVRKLGDEVKPKGWEGGN